MSIVTSAGAALWASIVRTLVPLIAGAVITWLVALGLELDPEFTGALTTVLYGVFSGVYYIAVRLFETYVSPKFGWLLGLAKAPAAYAGGGTEGIETLAPSPSYYADGKH